MFNNLLTYTFISHLKLTIILFGLLITTFCNGQIKISQTNNINVEVGKIPKLESFLKLTKQEKQIESNSNKYDKHIDSLLKTKPVGTENKFIKKTEFKKNRSRLSMFFYKNDEQKPYESTSTELPASCECFTYKDTLFIKMGLGFRSGYGFKIEISKNNFQSSFFQYVDDYKPFKSSLNDTVFENHIIVKSKYQYLMVDKKIDFKVGQQITGYLTLTTNNYYKETYGNQIDNIFLSSKIYFSCKTMQGSIWWDR